MPRVISLFLLSALACSGAVDRTPPRRDIGLPAVPLPPPELAAVDAGQVAELKAIGLLVPPDCQIAVAMRRDRRSLDCAKHFEATMPDGWKRVGDLPIWVKDGLAVTQSWHQKGERWILTQSLHQSKGDQSEASSVFGTESSKAPQ